MKFDDIIKRMDETYKLNIKDVAEELKNIGISVIDNKGKYKLFNEIVEEVALEWKYIDNEKDKFIQDHILRSIVGLRDKVNLRIIIEMINNE